MWQTQEKDDYTFVFNEQDGVVIRLDKDLEIPYLINALIQVLQLEGTEEDMYCINVKPSCTILITKENAIQLLGILFPTYRNFCFDGLNSLQ